MTEPDAQNQRFRLPENLPANPGTKDKKSPQVEDTNLVDSNPKVELVSRACVQVSTEISAYDKVSSSLSATVLLLGFTAAMLIIIWASSLTTERFVIPMHPGFPNQTLVVNGVAEDIEPPGDEENPEIQEPSLMEAIRSLDVLSVTLANDIQESGTDQQQSKGSGKGDKRKKEFNPGPTPGNTSPWERWEIRFSASSIEDYAKQIDGLKIELGAAARNGDDVVYLNNITSKSPKIRSGKKNKEHRLYFVPSERRIRLWDKTLLKRSGIANPEQRIAVQFFPLQSIKQMAKNETKRIEKLGREASEVKRSVFEITGKAGDYSIKLKKVEFHN